MFCVKLNEPSVLEFTVVITLLCEKPPTNFIQLNETGTPAAFAAVSLLTTFPFALIDPQLAVQTGACFLQAVVNIENEIAVIIILQIRFIVKFYVRTA